MGYIRDMYGPESTDFIRGFIAAIDTYSVFDGSGGRVIGSPEQDARKAIVEAIRELNGDLATFGITPWKLERWGLK